MYFDGGHGLQLAWHAYAEVDSQHVYEDVVDATSGQVLFRNNIVDSAGTGKRWSTSPFVVSGGFPLNNGGLPGSLENFVGDGWMAPGATTL